MFGRQVRNAEGLEVVLEDFFRVPVRIEEFVGHWLSSRPSSAPASPRARAAPGWARTRWSASASGIVQSRFRVVLGPLTLRASTSASCRAGAALRALHDW